MRAPLTETAPAFVETAHRIVWATAATVDHLGRPWTRILHPLWSWDGGRLTGVVATSPLSPKAAHIDAHPHLSFTYWDSTTHDTATAQCRAVWDDTPEGRADGWRTLAEGPEPVGYDPSIIAGWDDPQAPGFGILRLEPWRLHVFPGTVLTQGEGQFLTWEAAA